MASNKTRLVLFSGSNILMTIRPYPDVKKDEPGLLLGNIVSDEKHKKRIL